MVTCQSKCMLQNSVNFATGNLLYLKKWKFVATNDSIIIKINEPVHEISKNMVCATSKASDQPAHMPSLIIAFASRLSIP